MRSSLEPCAAVRLAWAGTLTCCLLSLFGCSGEAEVTTLPEGAAGNLEEEPSLSSDSPQLGGRMPDGAEPNGSTSSEAQPSPAGLGGRAPDGTATDDMATAESSGSDVPDTEHCAAVSDWDPAWVQFEQEVLALVNENRSHAADCGVDGEFAAAPPLVMDPILRCSARLQSLDMFQRNFFDHTNPDGKDPFERMDAAGFKGGGAGENIAVGQISPEQVMRSWMDSDGHCSNVMRPNYTMLGVGYHPGAGGRGLGSNYWTQNFGAPARNCRNGCR